FLENALDQSLPSLLGFIWSHKWNNNTPADDIEVVKMAKYVLSVFRANCVKPLPLVVTNERTPFCEYVLPIFKYFSAATGLLSFIRCEKGSQSCKR
ncbi:hypothetical protein BDB00DRAFT_751783, partial [Zychaea mexicana]|uniref:uncharacterized protein n=1 Tax=Zychaea mexicana TaxID=64656 RepID=UPI0022FEF703